MSFKNYCWSIGTTSYRTKNFNKNIEEQLILLSTFRNKTGVNKNVWDKDTQEQYYYFLKDEGFLKGDAPRPDKDARQKTSGLVQLGLLTKNREITEAGNEILQMTLKGDFKSDNDLSIPKDSYLYLNQLLKTKCESDGEVVRPFLLFIYMASKHEHLTSEEFTYLLPLCINKDKTEIVEANINKVRNGSLTYDDVIEEVFMTMDNYKEAFKNLMENDITEELIKETGLNRKSPEYDKSYFPFFEALRRVFLEKKYDSVSELYSLSRKISGKPSSMWIKYLFVNSNVKSINNKKKDALNNTLFSNVENMNELKEAFFKKMHLFKIKSTLKDYYDLNRRYFKTSDIVLFEDSIVKLDTLPRALFKPYMNEAFEEMFKDCHILFDSTDINDVIKTYKYNENAVLSELRQITSTDINSVEEALEYRNRERYKRLEKIIEDKFNKQQIISLLEWFEDRKDNDIKSHITENADIPTLYEYVLGIIWYLVSEKEGDILDYLNLSLEVDLLPRSHASGGEADIVYKYQPSEHYQKHTLLLEATLTNQSNQRQAEMEPVSRHLGNYLLKHTEEAYCIFITNYLNINVVSDFVNRKNMKYYSSDGSKEVDGMKIIPLQTNELKTIVEKDIKYKTLYGVFDRAYNSNTDAKNWYSDNIVKYI